MEQWILTLWLVLTIAGMVILCGTLAVMCKLVGVRVLTTIYFAACMVMQLVFVLGRIWGMDPYRMPKAFCRLQPLIFSLGSYVLTAVAVCFSVGTFLVIKDFRLTGRGANSNRAQSPLTFRPWMAAIIILYPAAGFALYATLVLKYDAIKPSDDMHCDVVDPVWLRLLGYSGLNFVISWPALALSIYTSVQLFRVHRATVRAQRAARKRQARRREQKPKLTQAPNPSSPTFREKVLSEGEERRSNEGWTTESKTGSLDGHRLMPANLGLPGAASSDGGHSNPTRRASLKSIKGPIVRTLRRASPPWLRDSNTNDTSTTLVGSASNIDDDKEKTVSQHSHGQGHKYPPSREDDDGTGPMPTLDITLPHPATTHISASPRWLQHDQFGKWQTQQMMGTSPHSSPIHRDTRELRQPSAGGSDENAVRGGAGSDASDGTIGGGGQLWRRATEKRWGPAATTNKDLTTPQSQSRPGTANPEGAEKEHTAEGRIPLSLQFVSSQLPSTVAFDHNRTLPAMPAPLPALGSTEANLPHPAIVQTFQPAIIFLLNFQIAFFVVELLTSVSPVLDVIRGYPVPFGTQHVALVLTSWGPFIVWFSAPPFRRIVLSVIDRFFPDNSSLPSDSRRDVKSHSHLDSDPGHGVGFVSGHEHRRTGLRSPVVSPKSFTTELPSTPMKTMGSSLGLSNSTGETTTGAMGRSANSEPYMARSFPSAKSAAGYAV